MLPKVAHYAGFQSYGDLPYPYLKPGRKALDSNTVYQETVRDGDKLQFYDNFNRTHTVYNKNLNKGVEPEHYTNPIKTNKYIVEGTALKRSQMGNTTRSVDPKATLFGATKRDNEHFEETNKGLQLFNQTVNSLKKTNGANNTAQNFGTQGGNSNGGFGLNKNERDALDEHTLRSEFLQTGVEHWKSVYNGSIKDPYAITKAQRPEWSYPKAAYQVDGGMKKSEYKTHFGERGRNPLATMTEKMLIQAPYPKSEDDLKLGTTCATYHTPGYTGHIPKTIASPDIMLQATGSIARATILKQNITENYHTRLPGYAGHNPRCALNDRGSLRQSCFSTQGERFF